MIKVHLFILLSPLFEEGEEKCRSIDVAQRFYLHWRNDSHEISLLVLLVVRPKVGQVGVHSQFSEKQCKLKTDGQNKHADERSFVCSSVFYLRCFSRYSLVMSCYGERVT